MATKNKKPGKPGRKPEGTIRKRKTAVTIDEEVYTIARGTGNVSRFINTAARCFAGSKEFRKYVTEWANG